MALTIYADLPALGAWLHAAVPVNGAQLLRDATFLVAQAANRDPYNDMPVGNDVQVLSDATCAQAAAWIAAGVDPAAGGLDVRVRTETKLGTGDVKFDVLSAEQIAEAVTCLALPAQRVLLAGGLLWLPVPLGADACDGLLDYGLGDRYWRPFLLI